MLLKRQQPDKPAAALNKFCSICTSYGVYTESGIDPKITALHRRWLTITGNRYAPARHRGIAELYVMDERFTAYYDKRLPGCARFLRDAVVHWVK